jgi:hypothetical protein
MPTTALSQVALGTPAVLELVALAAPVALAVPVALGIAVAIVNASADAAASISNPAVMVTGKYMAVKFDADSLPEVPPPVSEAPRL